MKDPDRGRRPLPLAPATRRTCGGCTACCVAYPLVPAEGYWPDGKPAYTPCRYLCADGCGIHDRPRPPLCTDFACGYLLGTVPQRPSECGVLFSVATLYTLLLGQVPPGLDGQDPGLQLVEARPGAVLGLEARRVRYWHRRVPARLAVVMPYGVDVHGPVKVRYHPAGGVAVYWEDGPGPGYADRVIDWWGRN
jgi:hypothetical protein